MENGTHAWYTFIVTSLTFNGVLAIFSVLAREPHFCRSTRTGCCPGWRTVTNDKPCSSPVCRYGCGSGYCMAPNTCRCADGTVSIKCPRFPSVPLSRSGSFVPIPGSPSNIQSSEPESSCETVRCQQGCHMVQGIPRCSCIRGFSVGIDGLSCKDVNECETFPGICQQTCHNTPGSFICACSHGYTLRDNGRTCRRLFDYNHSKCRGKACREQHLHNDDSCKNGKCTIKATIKTVAKPRKQPRGSTSSETAKKRKLKPVSPPSVRTKTVIGRSSNRVDSGTNIKQYSGNDRRNSGSHSNLPQFSHEDISTTVFKNIVVESPQFVSPRQPFYRFITRNSGYNPGVPGPSCGDNGCGSVPHGIVEFTENTSPCEGICPPDPQGQFVSCADNDCPQTAFENSDFAQPCGDDGGCQSFNIDQPNLANDNLCGMSDCSSSPDISQQFNTFQPLPDFSPGYQSPCGGSVCPPEMNENVQPCGGSVCSSSVDLQNVPQNMCGGNDCDSPGSYGGHMEPGLPLALTSPCVGDNCQQTDSFDTSNGGWNYIFPPSSPCDSNGCSNNDLPDGFSEWINNNPGTGVIQEDHGQDSYPLSYTGCLNGDCDSNSKTRDVPLKSIQPLSYTGCGGLGCANSPGTSVIPLDEKEANYPQSYTACTGGTGCDTAAGIQYPGGTHSIDATFGLTHNNQQLLQGAVYDGGNNGVLQNRKESSVNDRSYGQLTVEYDKPQRRNTRQPSASRRMSKSGENAGADSLLDQRTSTLKERQSIKRSNAQDNNPASRKHLKKKRRNSRLYKGLRRRKGRRRNKKKTASRSSKRHLTARPVKTQGPSERIVKNNPEIQTNISLNSSSMSNSSSQQINGGNSQNSEENIGTKVQNFLNFFNKLRSNNGKVPHRELMKNIQNDGRRCSGSRKCRKMRKRFRTKKKKRLQNSSKTKLQSTPYTTESPCPSHLRPVETPVGRICQYVPSIVDQSSSPPTITDNKTPEQNCPDGTYLLDTEEGTKCMSDSPGCPEGYDQVRGLDGIECKPKSKPCPLGQVSVQTKKGLMCQFSVMNTEGLHTDISGGCDKGEILTQTVTGFFCQPTTIDLNEWTCHAGKVIVQLKHELVCMPVVDTTIVCTNGLELVMGQFGFMCIYPSISHNLDHGKPLLCNKDEVVVQDEYGRRCVEISSNEYLCGEGHKAVRLGEDMVCKPVTMEIKCPDGFYLIETGGSADCVSSTDSKRPMSPCLEHYDVTDTGEGSKCVLNGGVSKCSDDTDQPGGSGCVRTLADLALDSNPQCSNGGKCVNGSCECQRGVRGVACEQDVDECSIVSSGYCQYRCENTFGSFRCTCPAGTTLNTDGRTCTEIQCVPECLNRGHCVNGRCECSSGFEGTVCQEDIDECSRYTNLCQHRCRNTYGSYACVCPPGSLLRQDRRTCLNTTCSPSCRNGGICRGNRCRCRPGYDGIACQIDVNECYPNPCSHNCKNIPGSYQCSCPIGFFLRSDKHSCRKIRQ